uniref:LOW QUALITY PROTEIN: protein yippee-like At5g53940 n=1 Tax=Fragaria vesca subsp. vesca TaxID=101020 RepID=UPI0005C9C613|nr:PREDICTED: LOW QUALITY PROTEIN: protein yippee-like At5g53940 [Fragaria vesca subsp. vesca]
MGRIFVVELEGRSYRCKFCKTHLALASDCVSRAFHCRRGKAFLFNNAHKTTLILFQHNDFPNKEASQNQTKAEWVNITIGALEERMMLSGVHTVADTFCCFCGQILGWKYETAHETAQKYKEGKFVLERGRIVEEVDFSTEFDIDSEDGLDF